MKFKILLPFALLVLAALQILSQTGPTSSFSSGSSLPASCQPGQSFWLTSGAVGLYSCAAAGVWSGTATSTPSATVANYYIATTGSDSNPCTSASPCLTWAHTRTILPTVPIQPPQINIANGAYAECLDVSGIITAGNPYGLTILGNNSSPASVQFTGTCNKTIAGVSTSVGAYMTTGQTVTLKGLEINVTASSAILCQGCDLLVLDNVTVAGTHSNSSVNIQDGGGVYVEEAVNISGFGSNLGFDIHGGSWGSFPVAGTLTLTGSGAPACMIVEHGSHFSVSQSSPSGVAANFSISGCIIAVNVAGHSGFTNFSGTGNFSATNGGSTPSNSQGIFVGNGSSFDWVQNGGTFTVDHYTTCLYANSSSEITQVAASATRTLSNCTTSSAVSGSTITLDNTTPWIALPYAGAPVLKDFGSGLMAGAYMIDSTGRVSVRGVVTCATTGTVAANVTLWQFPAGFRPTSPVIVPVDQNGSLTDYNVGTDGTVSPRQNWVCTSGTNYSSYDGSFNFSIW